MTLAAERPPAPDAVARLCRCLADLDQLFPAGRSIRDQRLVVEERLEAHREEDAIDAAHGVVEDRDVLDDVAGILRPGVRGAEILRPAVHSPEAADEIVGEEDVDAVIAGLAPERDLGHHIRPRGGQDVVVDLDTHLLLGAREDVHQRRRVPADHVDLAGGLCPDSGCAHRQCHSGQRRRLQEMAAVHLRSEHGFLPGFCKKRLILVSN